MSESEIGIFGQMYVDRKSKKSGRLLRVDTKNSTVVLIDSNEEEFTVNATIFRNNWRRSATTSEASVDTEDTKSATTEERKEKTMKLEDYGVNLTDEEIENIREYLTWRKQNVKGSNNKELENLMKIFNV